MIKNLLNADEEMPSKTKAVVEENTVNPPEELQIPEPLTDEETKNLDARQIFEIPEDAKFFAKMPEVKDEILEIGELSAPSLKAINETENDEFAKLEFPEAETANLPSVEQINDEKINNEAAVTIFQSEFKPESTAETIRQSGLAYSAAIIFFASVVFMLIIGWFADLLLGSSPWGIVGGIILGGVIGFVQFFRITSQIFKK